MTIYIVENYSSGEFEAFEELEQAAAYARQYYREQMMDWISNSSDSVLRIVQSDLKNLEADYPFIEDTMYIHNVTLHS